MSDDNQSISSAEARILDASLDHIRADLARLSETMRTISQALQILPVMQQSQVQFQLELQRGQTTFQDHENRLRQIETELPGLKELRKWVITGLLAGIGLVLTAVVSIVVNVPNKVAIMEMKK